MRPLYLERTVFALGVICILFTAGFTQESAEMQLAKNFVLSWEAKLENQTTSERLYTLHNLATASYQAGDHKKARQFAEDLQEEIKKLNGKHMSRAMLGTHSSNTILGLIALDNNQIEDANNFILASAAITGSSPHLQSFGPSMLLAKRLLEKGQQDTVLKYLDLCSVFWKDIHGNLEPWKTTIKKGGIPDFGRSEQSGLTLWKVAS